MLVRKTTIVLLMVGMLGIAGTASAQDVARPKQDKTFLQRLDNLGNTIFGGILPADKPKPRTTSTARVKQPALRPPKVTEPPDETEPPQQGIGQRAGSILAGPETDGSPRGGKRGDDMDITPDRSPVSLSRTAEGTPRPVRRPLAGKMLDESDKTESSAPQPSADLLSGTSDDRPESAESKGRQPETPRVSQSPSRPLHERLSEFRQSAFGEGAHEATAQSRSAEDEGPRVDKSTAAGEKTAKPDSRLLVAERVKPAFDIPEAPPAEPAHNPVASTPSAAQRAPSAAEKLSVVAKAESDSGLLAAHKGPVLSVETLGPRRIAVGKESNYEVCMVNSGEVAAEELMIFVSLPPWAEVAGAEPSHGTVEGGRPGEAAAVLRWKLGHLDAKGRERMTLKIIPRQNKPFDLAVRWESKPVASEAMIEVQEPKLALQLEGPREILYGKKETYQLKLTNLGNGGAENVTIMLMPIGGGENVPATHKIGVLAAGEEKVLNVELTARQSGNLTIQADARADGGARAELTEKVVVRRPGLKIEVEGPKVQFVGAAASYGIRVRNTGTAQARNVGLSVTLPIGAKYLAGIDDARLDSMGSKLQWTVESLNPQAQQVYTLKCSLGAAGMSRLQVDATADDDLTASANTVTRVESVANLTMDVKDPQGPVPIGDEVTYEVRVRNRGTKEAVGVEVFAYFSRGIEPTNAEGAPNRLGPGQVTFEPIPLLAPGAEAILKVRARAQIAGNHIFRAEAHCRPLGARLISEATNLYYAETPVSQRTAGEESGNQWPAPDAVRTVNRSAAEQMPVPPRK